MSAAQSGLCRLTAPTKQAAQSPWMGDKEIEDENPYTLSEEIAQKVQKYGYKYAQEMFSSPNPQDINTDVSIYEESADACNMTLMLAEKDPVGVDWTNTMDVPVLKQVLLEEHLQKVYAASPDVLYSTSDEHKMSCGIYLSQKSEQPKQSVEEFKYKNPSLEKGEIQGEGVRSTYFVGQSPVLGLENLQFEAHRGCYGHTIAEILKEKTPLQKRGSNSRTNIVCDIQGCIHLARCLQATCFLKAKDHVEPGLEIMMLKTDEFGKFTLTLQGGQTLRILIDSGAVFLVVSDKYVQRNSFLKELPCERQAFKDENVHTALRNAKVLYWTQVCLEFPKAHLQFWLMVTETEIPDMLLLGKMALNDLQAILDCCTQHLHIFQHTAHTRVMQDTAILPQRKALMMLKIKAPIDGTKKCQDLTGTAILWVCFQEENFRPMLVEIVENKMCVQVYNPNAYPYTFVKGDLFGYVDLQSCGVKYDVYDCVFKLKPPMVMTMQPIFAGEQEKMKALQTHLHHVCEPWKAHLPKEGEDQWPWLDKDDPKRQKTDVEILRDQVRLLTHLDEQTVAKLFTNMTEHIEAFSLQNEVGTCPFYKVHLSLTDDTPFFIRPYDLKQELVAVMDKEVDRFVKRGILVQGHMGYVSPVKLIE